MAQNILRFIGVVLLLVGAIGVAVSVLGLNWLGISASLGTVVAGAAMIGFAQIIELLQEIATNTRSPR